MNVQELIKRLNAFGLDDLVFVRDKPDCCQRGCCHAFDPFLIDDFVVAKRFEETESSRKEVVVIDISDGK